MGHAGQLTTRSKLHLAPSSCKSEQRGQPRGGRFAAYRVPRGSCGRTSQGEKGESSEKGGSDSPAGWCCWVCAIAGVGPPPGGGVERENTGWNCNKENPTPHTTPHHRTAEGSNSDTAEIQSRFLSRWFVSIQVNKQFFFK